MDLPSPPSTPEPLRPSRELLTAWLLLLVEHGVTHGYDMRRELAERRLEVDYASVYRMLRKLQRDGQLRSRWGKTVVGPRRRLYQITPAGQRTLAEIAERITAISETHHMFLQTYAQPADQHDFTRGEAYDVSPSDTAATGLDHVALAVSDAGAMEAFLRDHLGMRQLGRSAEGVLVGADARATKLGLIPAEGPREPAALARLVLRVADLQRAVASLPRDIEIVEDDPEYVTFEGPEGLGLGFTLAADGGIDYDLDHVILRVADPHETRTALAAFEYAPRAGALDIADKRIRLEELPAWSERPLLDHIAIRVESIEQISAQARERGLEIDERLPGETLTLVLPGPEQIRLEFIVDRPAE